MDTKANSELQYILEAKSTVLEFPLVIKSSRNEKAQKTRGICGDFKSL